MLLGLVCLLGSAVVYQCDYVPLAASIPPTHLALIRCVEPSVGHGWASPGGCIGLPPRATLHVLAHEIGHQVSWIGWPSYRDQFAAEFWPGGIQRGGLPTSYARRSPDEDFAEAYAHVVMRDTWDMPARAAWLLRHFPELREVPRAD